MKEKAKVKASKGVTSEERDFERRLRKETSRLVAEHEAAKYEEFAFVLSQSDYDDEFDSTIVVELVKRFSRSSRFSRPNLRAEATYGFSGSALAKIIDASRASGFTFEVGASAPTVETARAVLTFTYEMPEEVYGMLESQARTTVQDKLVAERESALDESAATA